MRSSESSSQAKQKEKFWTQVSGLFRDIPITWENPHFIGWLDFGQFLWQETGFSWREDYSTLSYSSSRRNSRKTALRWAREQNNMSNTRKQPECLYKVQIKYCCSLRMLRSIFVFLLLFRAFFLLFFLPIFLPVFAPFLYFLLLVLLFRLWLRKHVFNQLLKNF